MNHNLVPRWFYIKDSIYVITVQSSALGEQPLHSKNNQQRAETIGEHTKWSLHLDRSPVSVYTYKYIHTHLRLTLHDSKTKIAISSIISKPISLQKVCYGILQIKLSNEELFSSYFYIFKALNFTFIRFFFLF